MCLFYSRIYDEVALILPKSVIVYDEYKRKGLWRVYVNGKQLKDKMGSDTL